MKNKLRLFLFYLISYGLCGPAVSGFAQDVSFSSPMNFAAGDGPDAVAVGDFNRDGNEDLAVANADGNTVSIFLGNRDGSFGAVTNIPVGNSPKSVILGDFNGDEKQDLVVRNANSNIVSILLGNGDGSFGAATNFNAGSNPVSMAVGDFNGDGKQDLAVANFLGDNVSIFLNMPAVQKLSNISTRSRVLTGDNAMIGGFIIAGSTPMRVLIRSRGPAMSGAPFFVTGTLANPLLRLFSGQTLIAQNDNWQDPTSCSGFICEGAAAIQATRMDPCEPNLGQAGPPPNCALESAILITLPPGAYRALSLGQIVGPG